MAWWPFSRESKPDIAEQERVAGSAAQQKPAEPLPTNYTPGQKLLLEDTRPRFDTQSSASQQALQREHATLVDAWKTVRWEDFSFERMTGIPCFRDAGMAGFSAMVVAGSVTFLFHKNPVRAANWGFGGLLLGSIVGWEQCRMRRRRSFQVAEMARQTVAAKEAPMLQKPDNAQKAGTVSQASELPAKKPWYRFW
ncbi:AaceriABR199Cp [[Ashbya] aceris (nom. inval.)]|nr:AaceriABR199Cp [[Ashbya] aceris (nom. inval.)]